MESITPEKISGLLDGELSPEEAEAVRRAISSDESVRREYERLLSLDGQMKTAARAAAFRPRAALRGAAGFRLPLLLLASALLLLRLAVKTAPPVSGAVLETIVLAVLVGWALKRLLRASDQDLLTLP